MFYANVRTDASAAFNASRVIEAGRTEINLSGSPRSRPFVGDVNNDELLDPRPGAADGLVRLYRGLSATGPLESSGPLQADGGGLYQHTFEVGGNYPPAAVDDPFIGVENSGFSGEEPGVLANDSEPQRAVAC